MSGVDGFEQRQGEQAERESRIPDHDTRANAADAERDALWSTPVACVTNGHLFYGRPHCARCGVSREVAMAIVGGVA